MTFLKLCSLVLIALLSFFQILWFLSSGLISGIKLAIFNLIASIFLIIRFIMLDTYNSDMVNIGERIENIEEKIEDIHQDHFFGGRKRREMHNFVIGLIIGIGLALIVEAGIDWWVKYNEFNLFSKILLEKNMTISNLTITEQINYLSLGLTNMNLLFLIGIGIIIIYLGIFYYTNINRNLFKHEVIYSYKLRRGKKLSELADFIGCLFKETEKRKLIGIKVNYDPIKKRIIIVCYNKIRWYLLLEIPNRVVISNGKIRILCQTSRFGEDFEQTIEYVFRELRDKKKPCWLFAKLKREHRR